MGNQAQAKYETKTTTKTSLKILVYYRTLLKTNKQTKINQNSLYLPGCISFMQSNCP